MLRRSSSSGLVFLTTLIDLLVQIVFLFLLMIAQLGSEARELANDIKSSGLSISSLQSNWRRLIDIDRLEKGLVEKQRRIDEALLANDEKLALLKSKSDALAIATKGSGGRDLPPCWTKDTNPEYLLSIEILEDGLWVRPAWDQNRELDANSLGLYRDQIEGLYNTNQFLNRFKHLRRQVGKTGKCSHFVLVTDDPTTSKTAYKQNLSVVESLFYKKIFSN